MVLPVSWSLFLEPLPNGPSLHCPQPLTPDFTLEFVIHNCTRPHYSHSPAIPSPIFSSEYSNASTPPILQCITPSGFSLSPTLLVLIFLPDSLDSVMNHYYHSLACTSAPTWKAPWKFCKLDPAPNTLILRIGPFPTIYLSLAAHETLHAPLHFEVCPSLSTSTPLSLYSLFCSHGWVQFSTHSMPAPCR